MFDTTNLKVLEMGLNAASERQNVIANNLANIDTPGFKQSSVVFEDLLNESLQQGDTLPLTRTNPAHFGNPDPTQVQPQIETETNTSIRPDGNNVAMDQQMTELAKNGIYYNALTQQISSQLALLRMVISEKP